VEKEEAAANGVPADAFVGRSRELSELRVALEKSIAGRGSCFLISGEPGIGKTRLADELAADADSRGVRVAWGRCWEGGGAPAYWPWVEIVRCLVLEPGRARQPQTAVPPAIGQLIPELAAETAQQRSSLDPEPGRFRLFDAVATLVKQVARANPVVLILDDLHEADRGSLELLKFVARGLTDSRVVIVGTYREAEVRRSSYLAEAISEIVRHGHPMPLAGLAENEVAQMIEHRAERSPSAAFASELHSVTAGNPLFVDGVIRVLVAERKLGMAEHLDLSGFKLPEGVRGAIRKRLALLSAEARSALAVAAVIGQEFDVVLLERVNQQSAGTLTELMREAAEVGIVAAPSRETYRFTHPLIREALYKDSTDAERTRLHQAIAEALEQMHAANLAPHLAALAHHFREAGIVEKAIDYSIRAADAEFAVFAFEEAASHWQAALELMDEQGGGDPQRRAQILYKLSDESVSPGFKSVEYCQAALQLFEASGSSEEIVLAHTRLALYWTNPSVGKKLVNIPLAMEHFHKAEAYLTEKSPVGLITYHVTMAQAWSVAMRVEEGLLAARSAMEVSERFGSDLGWAYGAGFCSGFLICKGLIAEGLNLAEEARKRAEPLNHQMVGAVVAAIGGGNYRFLNDPQTAKRWYEDELAKPRTKQAPARLQYLLIDGIAICLFDFGEFVEARRAFADTDAVDPPAYFLWAEGPWEGADHVWDRNLDRDRIAGRRIDETMGLCFYGRFLFTRGELGRAAEVLEKALAQALEGGHIVLELTVRLGLVGVLLDLQRSEQALSQLEHCRAIMANGEDWRGLAAPMARAEGAVAAANGNYSDAETQFQRSISVCQRYSLLWDEAETLFFWGRALLAAGNRDHAAAKFDAAITIYESHGFATEWIDRALAEKARIKPPETTEPAFDQLPSDDECLFRREGEYWTVAYRGLTCRLRDMKGLGYIAHLLAHPGDRIHVLDLLGQVVGSGADTVLSAAIQAENLEVALDLDDASEVVDSRARAEYRRRLSELHAELEEAESNNDPGRVERARDELDSLTDALSSALGLGGRSRRFTAETERARGPVSKSIRKSLERIRRSHRELGDHLSTCIRTGYFCAYLPDPGRQPSWRI